MERAHYHHCATKGFDHSILFLNEQEYIAGMNRIGICLAAVFGVQLIAFCLMDNHVHFILYGTKADCLKWMNLYYRLTMIWQGHHRSEGVVDEKWLYNAWQIVDPDDLRQKVVYVHRNPTVAAMWLIPSGYRWSSARLIFADSTDLLSQKIPIGGLSRYEIRKRFETKILLPADWFMLADGMIWPGCYTRTDLVERLFGHPWKYLYELNQQVESGINLEMWGNRISLPDHDAVKIASTEALRRFGVSDLEMLDVQQRIILGKALRKKTGANVKQLSRILHIMQADLKSLFE